MVGQAVDDQRLTELGQLREVAQLFAAIAVDQFRITSYNVCYTKLLRPGLANHEPQPTVQRFVDLLFPYTRVRPEAADGAERGAE